MSQKRGNRTRGLDNKRVMGRVHKRNDNELFFYDLSIHDIVASLLIKLAFN